MTCSTNFSTRSRIVTGVFALFWLSGCAMMGGQGGMPLEFESLQQEKVGSSPMGFPIIHWTASASGGSGELRYEFRTLKGSVEIIAQDGASPTWDWTPRKPGTFHVKATVTDDTDFQVDSGWSSEIVARSPIGKDSLIAILPVENLSGGRAPLEPIGQLVRSKLRQKGFRLVDDEVLEEFLKRYRIRHTGGLHSFVSQAIKEETGAEAYLVTSLDSYQDLNGPLVSLFSRLVLSGERSEVLWMDGVGLSGDGYPGFLGLGVMEDPDLLVDEAVDCLADSLERFLWAVGEATGAAASNAYYACGPRAKLVSLPAERRGKRRYRPRSFFRDPSLSVDSSYTVAVIPFLNLSDRNNAGKIVALHFLNQLIRTENFAIVEPGLLREQLLRYRIIMQAGPSIANAELISAESSLGVDLVFSGTVFDYQDAVTTPKVDFSVKIINARSRKMVWSSKSHNTGEEGVFFFDVGRIYTAHHLASEMAWGTFEALARGPHSPNVPRTDPRNTRQQSRSSNFGSE